MASSLSGSSGASKPNVSRLKSRRKSAGTAVPCHAQFRKELNRTPSKAIRDRRIALAERLLRYTNLNVREISRRCGFPEESSFCRFFQTRNHMTPIQFRQQNSNRSADKEESADALLWNDVAGPKEIPDL